jgi:hypothetical protein
MMLKSISSFIATILLIGFTISTGIIVYYFASTLPRTQTQQVSSLSQQVISCAGGFFDIKIFREGATISLNGNYNRKPVLIDNTLNPNTLTDYQVLVNLDTASLISQGKMRSDCGDIRFTDSDGSTLLNYWIESGCNTANTRIWVKVPSIPASSTKTIYVYYGNSSANSLSNYSATMFYIDWTKDKNRTAIFTNAINYGTIYYWYVYQSGIADKIYAWGEACCGQILYYNRSIIYNGNCVECDDEWNFINVTPTSNLTQEIGHYHFNRIFRIGRGSYWYFEHSGGRDVTGVGVRNGGGIVYTKDIPREIRVRKDYYFYFNITLTNPTSSSASICGEFTYCVALDDNPWSGNDYGVGTDKCSPDLREITIPANSQVTKTINCTANSTTYLRIGAAPIRVIAISASPEPTTRIGNGENITINLISSGNPTASMGNQFIAIIYLTNGTIIQKDFSLENNCNLGKDCILGKSTISLNSNVPIDKIKVCSKACSLICNEYKVS